MKKEVATKEEMKLVKTMSTQANGAMVIKTDKDVENTAEVLVAIKTQYDELEEQRKSYVQPAQETIKRINTDFKKLTEPRSFAITLLKEKVIEYVKGRKAEVKVAEKKIQKEMKDRSLVLDNDLDRVFCDHGELRFRSGYSFKITSMKQIPPKYWVLDEKSIQKDIEHAEGDIKIPGIKVNIEDIHSVAIYKDR